MQAPKEVGLTNQEMPLKSEKAIFVLERATSIFLLSQEGTFCTQGAQDVSGELLFGSI